MAQPAQGIILIQGSRSRHSPNLDECTGPYSCAYVSDHPIRSPDSALARESCAEPLEELTKSYCCSVDGLKVSRSRC